MLLSIRTVCALALAASVLVSGCDEAGTPASDPAARIAPAQPIPEFAPGVTVIAAQYPSLQGILGEGFSPKETSGAWTDGGRAVMRLPLAQSALGKPLQLELKLVPYLHPPELTRQPVEVRMESAIVAKFDIAGMETVTVPFTATVSPAVFEFTFPAAVSPESFKAGDDPRKLGVYLTSIAVVEPAAPVVEAPPAAAADAPTAATPPAALPAPAKPVTPPAAKPSPPVTAQPAPAPATPPAAPAPVQPAAPAQPPPQ